MTSFDCPFQSQGLCQVKIQSFEELEIRAKTLENNHFGPTATHTAASESILDFERDEPVVRAKLSLTSYFSWYYKILESENQTLK